MLQDHAATALRTSEHRGRAARPAHGQLHIIRMNFVNVKAGDRTATRYGN